MLRIKINNFSKTYLLAELINMFLSPDEYEIVDEALSADFVFNESGAEDKNEIKRNIYDVLSKYTGKILPWGILTGIRPVKLYGELSDKLGDEKATIHFKSYYYVSDEKISLIRDMYKRQILTIGRAPHKSCGLYIGIPFCPTRCLYCSFASNQEGVEEVNRYFDALIREMNIVAKDMEDNGFYPETVYIGGGTPTSLSAKQIELLMRNISDSFDMKKIREITFEAGRPDTLDAEKLSKIKEGKVTRISINPQSMKDETLSLIGRRHTVKQSLEAFETARLLGFDNINMDLIAGLTGENIDDFMHSLKTVSELEPESITIHSLAVKRASLLIEKDRNFHYKQNDFVTECLKKSAEYLYDKGYMPYYLYRQKHMAGNGENVGYCKKGAENIYNMRIMDEHQNIIALGAGGISKAYFHEENRLERVPNVTNYREYINRVEEMAERKRKNIFMEVK